MQLNAVLLNAAEGGYVAINPETGACSQGETVDETVANLREATELYLEARPDECPQGETWGVGVIKPMMVSVDESLLEDGR
ncbi:MAG: type II toxin-antitoxin system HicB family antitoxin [Gammaproteobacteria bacterium]|nr:type II toxin-antitoxin system HicB family antitoxin [Gammaproteobacteria bacterium]MDA8023651.1 type II toxin-antitoxin system HicB family antitoxin [Gammaproteobacteria bacterium]